MLFVCNSCSMNAQQGLNGGHWSDLGSKDGFSLAA